MAIFPGKTLVLHNSDLVQVQEINKSNGEVHSLFAHQTNLRRNSIIYTISNLLKLIWAITRDIDGEIWDWGFLGRRYKSGLFFEKQGKILHNVILPMGASRPNFLKN